MTHTLKFPVLVLLLISAACSVADKEEEALPVDDAVITSGTYETTMDLRFDGTIAPTITGNHRVQNLYPLDVAYDFKYSFSATSLPEDAVLKFDGDKFTATYTNSLQWSVNLDRESFTEDGTDKDTFNYAQSARINSVLVTLTGTLKTNELVDVYNNPDAVVDPDPTVTPVSYDRNISYYQVRLTKIEVLDVTVPGSSYNAETDPAKPEDMKNVDTSVLKDELVGLTFDADNKNRNNVGFIGLYLEKSELIHAVEFGGNNSGRFQASVNDASNKAYQSARTKIDGKFEGDKPIVTNKFNAIAVVQ